MSRADRGSISAMLAVVAVSLVMVAGMVVDGGDVLATRATARRLASSAARAGAQHIDLTHLRATGTARLDAPRADAAARDFLAGRDVEVVAVVVGGAEVEVTVAMTHRMRILPLGERKVRVTEVVRATPGVTSGGQT